MRLADQWPDALFLFATEPTVTARLLTTDQSATNNSVAVADTAQGWSGTQFLWHDDADWTLGVAGQPLGEFGEAQQQVVLIGAFSGQHYEQIIGFDGQRQLMSLPAARDVASQR